MAIELLIAVRMIARLETGSPTAITTIQKSLAIIPKLVHKFVKGKPPPH
jgi:hypothetical protein